MQSEDEHEDMPQTQGGSADHVPSGTWQEELTHNITTVDELARFVPLSADQRRGMEEVIRYFPMSISRYYLSLMDVNDPTDPIFKMAIPDMTGLDLKGVLDTSGEADNTVLPGLQHKYRQTVLILSSNQCAMYCRHCFRRRLVGISGNEVAHHIDEMVEYIEAHPEINNVLLSGGDALINENSRIEEYLSRLSPLPQLDLIRIGSRTPVTFPYRIVGDPQLQEMLGFYNKQKQLYLVTHFNHPKECTPQARDAIRAIQAQGITVKNQTVLLKGINDDPQVLGTLLRTMSAWGVVEHYIFQCRPVLGVKGRFQVPLMEGYRIVSKANAMQNGLGKSAEYTLSNHEGKIRFIGMTDDGKFVLRLQESKDPDLLGRIYVKEIAPEVKWIDSLIDERYD